MIKSLHKKAGAPRRWETLSFDEEEIRRSIIRNAKAANIPEGAAEVMAKKITERVLAWAQKKQTITGDDLNRKIAQEAERYNSDLAYIYKEYGKII